MKNQVKKWMRQELLDDPLFYLDADGSVLLTPLAESAAWNFQHGEWLDDPDHWVWDAAFEVAEQYERMEA